MTLKLNHRHRSIDAGSPTWGIRGWNAVATAVTSQDQTAAPVGCSESLVRCFWEVSVQTFWDWNEVCCSCMFWQFVFQCFCKVIIRMRNTVNMFLVERLVSPTWKVQCFDTCPAFCHTLLPSSQRVVNDMLYVIRGVTSSAKLDMFFSDSCG